MTSINNRLKNLRIKRNLMQQEVANCVGLSLRSYQRYEKGEREPTVSILIALADCFDVSIDYLVGRTDNPDSHK